MSKATFGNDTLAIVCDRKRYTWVQAMDLALSNAHMTLGSGIKPSVYRLPTGSWAVRLVPRV